MGNARKGTAGGMVLLNPQRDGRLGKMQRKSGKHQQRLEPERANALLLDN
jgi:hypothetical protein